MQLCRLVKDYSKGGDATNDKIDYSLDFSSTFSKVDKTALYECYRLWARLLSHRRNPFKRHDRFAFNKYRKEAFQICFRFA